MLPKIERSRFGSITISGQVYKKDILITLDGSVTERPKSLSKELYGTSHIISLAEMEAVIPPGAATIMIGMGMFDRVRLSPEAEEYLEAVGCQAILMPTPAAVQTWNETISASQGSKASSTVGLFHITC